MYLDTCTPRKEIDWITKRLNDLVYVDYNLRLQQRYDNFTSHELIIYCLNFFKDKCKLYFSYRNYWVGRNYDPIDFEDFSFNVAWMLRGGISIFNH